MQRRGWVQNGRRALVSSLEKARVMYWLIAAAHTGAAHAADHSAEHADVMAMNWLPALTSLIVFLIAFTILAFAVWPKISKALDEREKKIRDEIKSAEEARAAAIGAQKQYEEQLAKAQREAQETIAKAKADARAAGEELRQENEKQLAEMKTRARRDIESAKETAIAELHAEASNLAATMAAKILQREISSNDQERLLEESLAELTNVRG
jgi:F-type H+-transporting ATPase subunit b